MSVLHSLTAMKAHCIHVQLHPLKILHGDQEKEWSKEIDGRKPYLPD